MLCVAFSFSLLYFLWVGHPPRSTSPAVSLCVLFCSVWSKNRSQAWYAIRTTSRPKTLGHVHVEGRSTLAAGVAGFRKIPQHIIRCIFVSSWEPRSADRTNIRPRSLSADLVTAEQVNLRVAGRQDDAEASGVKVRFIGTAKGMADEHVEPERLLTVSEETMRLKKASRRVRPCAVERRRTRVRGASIHSPRARSPTVGRPPLVRFRSFDCSFLAVLAGAAV